MSPLAGDFFGKNREEKCPAQSSGECSSSNSTTMSANYGAVMDTLKSGWITMGQRTIDFEEAYGKELGEGSKCVAVANGTAALHIAVLACGG